MDAARFAQVKEIFRAVLATDAAHRDTELRRACGADAELRRDVEALLGAAAVDTDAVRPAGDDIMSVPERIGDYEVDRELGRGGMGVVYLARARDSARPVALKVLHPWLHVVPGSVDRFRREADAGLAIRHENVVRTFGISSEEAGPGRAVFIEMEYVEGRTLRELLQDAGRLSESLLREVALQIAHGLCAIHDAGLLHRDLKPENVLITVDQAVRIMDLGVAKLLESSMHLTREGQFIGSLAYAAPEQFDHDPLTPASDLYSLGVMLYELAAGANPFAFDRPYATIEAQRSVPPAPLFLVEPATSPFFSELVACLTAKKPADRIASAEELVRVLREGERSSWWQGRTRDGDGRPFSVPIRRDTAMVGRTDAFAALQSTWVRARGGEGGVVVVKGEAGGGKTRLVGEWLATLESEPVHVLYGSFPPDGGVQGVVDGIRELYYSDDALADHIPSGPMREQLLARLREESGPSGDRGASLPNVAAQLLRSLSRERPLVWVIDDLHFASDEAMNSIRALARATRGRRALLVLTTRRTTDRSDQITPVCTPTVLELARLTGEEVTELLRNAYGDDNLAHDLSNVAFRYSEGVPLVVLQILRALRDQGIVELRDGRYRLARTPDDLVLPSAMVEIVGDRIRTLSAPHRRIIDAASVCGLEFDADLVARTVEMPLLGVLQELAEVERDHEIVRSRGGRYRFDHHAILEACYANLPDALRAELHARIADVLSEGERDGRTCLRVASHHLRGSRPREALPWMDDALRYVASRPGEGVALCRIALERDGLLEGLERAKVLLQYEAFLVFAGRGGNERIEVAREFLDLARASGDEEQIARALQTLATASIRSVRTLDDEPLEMLRESLDIARRIGLRTQEMWSAMSYGGALISLGHFDEGRENFLLAGECAREIPNLHFRANVLNNVGQMHRNFGELGDAERCYLEALDAAEQTDYPRVIGHIQSGMALLRWIQGRFEEALEHVAIQRRVSSEVGDLQCEMQAASHRGLLEYGLGLYVEAEASNERAVDLAALAGWEHMLVYYDIDRGHVAQALGQLTRAEELFDQARARLEAEGSSANLFPRVAVLTARANHALLAGQPEEARSYGEQTIACIGGLRMRESRAWIAQYLAAAFVQLGNPEAARDELRAGLASAPLDDRPLVAAPLAIRLALLEDDPRGAEGVLREYGSRIEFLTRMEMHWLLFENSGEPRHLDAARGQLRQLRSRLPATYHADLLELPLYRAIDDAAG